MLSSLLELPSVLQVLPVEVVHPVPLNPFATPSPNVHVSIGKGMLSLDQFSRLLLTLNVCRAERRADGLDRSRIWLILFSFDAFRLGVIDSWSCLSYAGTFPILILLPTAVILNGSAFPRASRTCLPTAVVLQSHWRLPLPPPTISYFLLGELGILLPLDYVVGGVITVVKGFKGGIGEDDFLGA